MEEYLRDLKKHLGSKIVELDSMCNEAGNFNYDERRTLRRIASMLDSIMIKIERYIPEE